MWQEVMSHCMNPQKWSISANLFWPVISCAYALAFLDLSSLSSTVVLASFAFYVLLIIYSLFCAVAITKWNIAYVPLDPVAEYIHMLDLNNRLRVGWKTLPNLKFKLKFQTQTWTSKKVIRDYGKLTQRVKRMKATKQWVGFQEKQWVSQGVGRRVLKISVLPSCFHFFGSEEKVSRAKRKLFSLCLSIIYLAPGI